MSLARRRRVVILASAFALLAAVAALYLGPAGATPGREIVLGLRLPRVLLGLLVGGMLAVAGVVLQALFRNDLAEPYLVGVGPGAFLGVTVAALAVGGLPGPGPRAVAALAGAVLVSGGVFAAARRTGRSTGPTLLLAGVAVGAFVSAVATAALYIAVDDWSTVVYWLLGHLGPRSPAELVLVAGALLVGFTAAFVRSRDLDAVALGEEGAWLVGVHVRRLVVVQGLLACLLAAVAVSAAGLIGFVGLLVPHLARRLVGPGHRWLLPTALALGAGLLVVADGVARVAHPPHVLPVGVVTAALGAPFLAWVLLRPR